MALVAYLTGMVTLTSTRIYVLHYSTYTCVPGGISIRNLRTVVLDYREHLAILVYQTEARPWSPTPTPLLSSALICITGLWASMSVMLIVARTQRTSLEWRTEKRGWHQSTISPRL
jgi:hypothetical protein